MSDEGNDFGFVAPEGVEVSTTDLDPFSALLEGFNPPEDIPQPDDEFGSLEDEFRKLVQLRRVCDALSQKKADLEELKRRQTSRVREAMEAQGTKQFRSSGGFGACSISSRYKTRVTNDQAFIRWATEHHPELLTVNAQTRTSFVRREFKDNGIPPDADEFPPGIEAEEEPTLSVRASRPRGERT